MKAFQDRLQQYKFMELSKKQQFSDLQLKIPDLEKNLHIIDHMKQHKEGDDEGEKEMETNFELNDTLYTRASINTERLDTVYLWLGADVMLEYPLDEAVELLENKLQTNRKQLEIVREDLEFLRENITTMEVNTARLYNWDVATRRAERGS